MDTSEQELYRAVGSRLGRRRRAFAWRIEQLAHATGIPYRRVSDIENGSHRTTLTDMLILARALDYPPEQLIADLPQVTASRNNSAP